MTADPSAFLITKCIMNAVENEGCCLCFEVLNFTILQRQAGGGGIPLGAIALRAIRCLPPL